MSECQHDLTELKNRVFHDGVGRVVAECVECRKQLAVVFTNGVPHLKNLSSIKYLKDVILIGAFDRFQTRSEKKIVYACARCGHEELELPLDHIEEKEK